MSEFRPRPDVPGPEHSSAGNLWLRWAAVAVAATVISASAAAAWRGAGLFDSEEDGVIRGGVAFWLAERKFRRITGRYFSTEDLTPERPEETILRVFHNATGSWPTLRLLPNDGGWVAAVPSGPRTYVLRGDEGLTLFTAPGRVDAEQLTHLAASPPADWIEASVPDRLLMADGLWILTHCPPPGGSTPTPPLFGPGPRYKPGSEGPREDSGGH